MDNLQFLQRSIARANNLEAELLHGLDVLQTFPVDDIPRTKNGDARRIEHELFRRDVSFCFCKGVRKSICFSLMTIDSIFLLTLCKSLFYILFKS